VATSVRAVCERVRFRASVADLTADHSLRVQRIYARGKVSEPKTKKSKAPVVVPVVLYKELVKLRSAPRTVLTARGYSRRVETAEVLSCDRLPQLAQPNLRPVSNGLGIRVNHLILRRTFATLAYNSGGDLKDSSFHARRTARNCARPRTCRDSHRTPSSTRVARLESDARRIHRARAMRIQRPPSWAPL